jgi:hypothetical protein
LFNKQDAVRGAEMAMREAEMVVKKAQRMMGKWKEENPEFSGHESKFIMLKEEVGSAMAALDSARSYHLSLEGTNSYTPHIIFIKFGIRKKHGYLRSKNCSK